MRSVAASWADTVARTHAGHNVGGRLLDWAGDHGYQAGVKWLRLDAWTTNQALQAYYVSHGFEHVRTVLEGVAVNGRPRVSGSAVQRPARPAGHSFTDETAAPESIV